MQSRARGAPLLHLLCIDVHAEPLPGNLVSMPTRRTISGQDPHATFLSAAKKEPSVSPHLGALICTGVVYARSEQQRRRGWDGGVGCLRGFSGRGFRQEWRRRITEGGGGKGGGGRKRRGQMEENEKGDGQGVLGDRFPGICAVLCGAASRARQHKSAPIHCPPRRERERVALPNRCKTLSEYHVPLRTIYTVQIVSNDYES